MPSPACANDLVSVFGELLLDLVVDLGRLLGLSQLPPCRLLALVVCGTLDLSPLLESTSHLLESAISQIVWAVSYLATTSWYFQPNS
jgi:hypothetical protein